MKCYIGDGVYVDFDGRSLVLTTENGVYATNRIVLESEVYAGLLAYVATLKQAAPKVPSAIALPSVPPDSPEGPEAQGAVPGEVPTTEER